MSEQRTAIKESPSLRASLKDGMANAAMLGLGENYLSAFAIALKALPLQVGVLATIPPLVSALSQTISVRAMSLGISRRLLISRVALVQALMWIPIGFLPLIYGDGISSAWILVGLAMIYYMLGGILAPAWNSLIGDIVPVDVRGAFFGLRSRLCSITSFLALIAAGQILHLCENGIGALTGFLAIFLLATGAKLISVYFLMRHTDPPLQETAEDAFSFWQFLRRTPHSNFARFVFFVSFLNAGVMFAGPYYAVYVLRELHFSYFQYTLMTAAATVPQFLTLERWGQLTDRFGNKRILQFCSYGVATTPLFWLLTDNFYLILAIQAYAGFSWAGYNLSVANFMFDAVTPAKRGRCLAYQSIINGVFVVVASLAGGYLASHAEYRLPLPSWFVRPDSVYLSLFLISSVIRMSVVLLGSRLFREVREVELIRHRDLFFRITHIRPLSGMTFRPITAAFRRGPPK